MSLDRSEQYQDAYLADYGFENIQVHYRQTLLLERLALHSPKAVVEIGCGQNLLYEAWTKVGGTADIWIIVEPAPEFVASARQSGLANLEVVADFFEGCAESIKQMLGRAPDMVICSSLLHEVPSAIGLLNAMVGIMGPGTLAHINVPNAGSFHRRLAMEMGLIADTKAFSERNVSLMQNRVYDLQSLRANLLEAGLAVVSEGGYLLKPFTHKQMEQIYPIIGEAVLDGLFKMGEAWPELASEIFVEARLLDGK